MRIKTNYLSVAFDCCKKGGATDGNKGEVEDIIPKKKKLLEVIS